MQISIFLPLERPDWRARSAANAAERRNIGPSTGAIPTEATVSALSLRNSLRDMFISSATPCRWDGELRPSVDENHLDRKNRIISSPYAVELFPYVRPALDR